ncbi:MAG: tRNA dihydrouridine(20/20a) synthase DusA [Spirochaetaceae bacterium]|nr:tRNA dihydrouridine(20/20a) synthase DusA [Spirochaetaceae bacterium]
MSNPHTKQPISLAPMVDKTDRDWRWIMRLITKKTLLYTEMIAAPAILHGKRDKLLAFDPSENPLVLQLGWDEPDALVESCRIAEGYGYDEINLNCGCPSDKVQKHDFGAALMARPEHVAHLLEVMAASTTLPVTVKNRIGIRSRKSGLSLEDYSHLHHFVKIVSEAGCRKFIVHARIAILEGLSPRANRDVPPLRPEDVYRLKEDFPDLFIEINGGYKTPRQIDAALEHVDAVMLGRIALDKPWMLSQADRRWFASDQPPPTRRDVLDAAVPYLIRRAEEGASRGVLIQPLMNLFAGENGAKAWKRALTAVPPAGPEGFASAMETAVKELPSNLLDEQAPDPGKHNQ